MSVRDTLDAIGDGVFIFDADTLHFTHVNQGAVEQVGYQRDELLGMTMLHIAPEFNEEKPPRSPRTLGTRRIVIDDVHDHSPPP